LFLHHCRHEVSKTGRIWRSLFIKPALGSSFKKFSLVFKKCDLLVKASSNIRASFSLGSFFETGSLLTQITRAADVNGVERVIVLIVLLLGLLS
jgi:hypothetical protein